MNLRISKEDLAYWTGSLLINLLIFTGFASLFLVTHIEIPEPQPLKIKIREVTIKSPPPKVAKQKKASKVNKRATATVEKAHKEGDVPVKVEKKKEEDVRILASIQESVREKLKEQKEKGTTVHGKSIGSISAVVSGSGITFSAGNRKIIYTPPLPYLVTQEFPAPLRIKIWVNPYGRVIKAVIVQRSGNAKIDSTLLRYIKLVKFEALPVDFVQTGEVVFRFTGG